MKQIKFWKLMWTNAKAEVKYVKFGFDVYQKLWLGFWWKV